MDPLLKIAAEAQAALERRVVFTFKVPEKLAAAEGVSSIGLVRLTSEEELDITDMAGPSGKASKVVRESILRTLVRVNDKKVTHVDGSADIAYKEMSAPIRVLALSAYHQLHAPKAEDSESFLKSMVVEG